MKIIPYNCEFAFYDDEDNYETDEYYELLENEDYIIYNDYSNKRSLGINIKD